MFENVDLTPLERLEALEFTCMAHVNTIFELTQQIQQHAAGHEATTRALKQASQVIIQLHARLEVLETREQPRRVINS